MAGLCILWVKSWESSPYSETYGRSDSISNRNRSCEGFNVKGRCPDVSLFPLSLILRNHAGLLLISAETLLSLPLCSLNQKHQGERFLWNPVTSLTLNDNLSLIAPPNDIQLFGKHITTYWIFKEYHYHPLENHMEMHMGVCGMENLNLLSRWWQARCTKTVYLSIWLAAPVSLEPSRCFQTIVRPEERYDNKQPEHESMIYVQLKWVMFVQFQRWRWSNWVQLSTYTISSCVYWACCCLTWFDSVTV